MQKTPRESTKKGTAAAGSRVAAGGLSARCLTAAVDPAAPGRGTFAKAQPLAQRRPEAAARLGARRAPAVARVASGCPRSASVA